MDLRGEKFIMLMTSNPAYAGCAGTVTEWRTKKETPERSLSGVSYLLTMSAQERVWSDFFCSFLRFCAGCSSLRAWGSVRVGF